MPVHFITPGLIDLKAISVMGLHSKDGENPIGYFGTGLKFALSTLLRSGAGVTVYQGKNKVTFDTVKMDFRGKEFDSISMTEDGKDPIILGYTTQLGKNWEMWMAFRELHSNTLDEKGETVYYSSEEESRESELSRYEDHTYIVVNSNEFDQEYHNRFNTFCSTPVLYENDQIQVRAGFCSNVFYRGVKVLELKKPTVFTYNFKRALDLTEDRTLKYQWMLPKQLACALASVTDPKVVSQVVCAPDGTMESSLPWDEASEPSDEFVATVKSLDNNGNLLSSVRKWAQKLGHIDVVDVEITPLQGRMLEKAKAFVEKHLGADLSEYPIRVVNLHGPLGQAENNQILLDPAIFERGTKYVAHGLFEEYVHLKTGFGDETRELQTYLFQRVLSMAEEVAGEPV